MRPAAPPAGGPRLPARPMERPAVIPTGMNHSAAKKFLVITSIAEPTAAVLAYAAMPDWRVVLVGDRKGPSRVDDPRIEFLDLERQGQLGLAYAALCPENHYARKNIGYLYAIAQGAKIIAETDDDNLPLPGWGENLDFSPTAIRQATGGRYCNVYRHFTDEPVWPRGFPLREILNPAGAVPGGEPVPAEVAAWQELADDDPDVDAIYRLTRGGRVTFRRGVRFVLGPGVYCRFNSQNTFWRREAFAALFLPGQVSMRYCDILRGYVAQRLFWAQSLRLGFGSASVRQLRNAHDLMRDLADELTMYREVESVVAVLEAQRPAGAMTDQLVAAYAALASAGLVPAAELAAAQAWSEDIRRLMAGT